MHMGKQSMDRWRRGEVRGGRGGLPRIGQVGGPGGGGSHLLFLDVTRVVRTPSVLNYLQFYLF
jgi:hypothetical protein